MKRDRKEGTRTARDKVEVPDEHKDRTMSGAEDNAYTAGVICAKVAPLCRAGHHPDR